MFMRSTCTRSYRPHILVSLIKLDAPFSNNGLLKPV